MHPEAAKYSLLNRHSQALHNSLPHFPIQYLTQQNKQNVGFPCIAALWKQQTSGIDDVNQLV